MAWRNPFPQLAVGIQGLDSQAKQGTLKQPRHLRAGAQPDGFPSPGRKGSRPIGSSGIAQEQGLGSLSQGALGSRHFWRHSGFRGTWRAGKADWWEATVGRGVKRVAGKGSDADIRKERQNDRGGQHREISQVKGASWASPTPTHRPLALSGLHRKPPGEPKAKATQECRPCSPRQDLAREPAQLRLPLAHPSPSSIARRACLPCGLPERLAPSHSSPHCPPPTSDQQWPIPSPAHSPQPWPPPDSGSTRQSPGWKLPPLITPSEQAGSESPKGALEPLMDPSDCRRRQRT